jgi:hypothetical protein
MSRERCNRVVGDVELTSVRERELWTTADSHRDVITTETTPEGRQKDVSLQLLSSF